MKPIIGITTGENVNLKEPWAPIVYGQKHTYSDAIIAAGGIPLLIPFMPEAQLRSLYDRLDGLFFAGGNDISPQLYGEQTSPLTRDISPERDRVEMLLMKWAIADNKPIFAICRGFQMLNVHLGGSLYQDIATELPHASDHEFSLHEKDYKPIAHTLTITPHSRLALIIHSDTLNANSRHHQGIKKLSHELNAVARSEDGLIEAVEHPQRSFVMGVQCHPESLYQADEKWEAVFKTFVNEASKQLIPARLFKFKRRTGTKPFPNKTFRIF